MYTSGPSNLCAVKFSDVEPLEPNIVSEIIMTIGGVVSDVLPNIFRELDELEAKYRRREV